MHYMKRGMIAAALAMMTSAGAQAADSPFYAGASGGVAFPSTSHFSGGATGGEKYSFSSGGDVFLGFQPDALSSQDKGDVRFELQGGYHALGLKSVTVGAVTNANPSGDLKAATAMANAYFDLHTGTPFTPYVGAGLGLAHVKIPGGNGLGNTGSTDNKLAYQGMAGVAYTAPSMPRADWTLGYRYLGVKAPSFSSGGGDIKVSPVRESAIELGFRYHF